MDLYLKPVGMSLNPEDKVIFDEVKDAIDRATSDFLIKPDYEANMRVVDMINPQNNKEILKEVIFYFRKKLKSTNPKLLVLTLKLLECLATNCSTSWYETMNDEKFTKELGQLTKKYVALMGTDNREVADLCLDLIQGWGEAFLTRNNQYQNNLNLYFNLRKDGLPFKTDRQFDPTRVPIFDAPRSSSNDGTFLDPMTNQLLQASLESAKYNNSANSNANRRSSSTSDVNHRSNNVYNDRSGSNNFSSAVSSNNNSRTPSAREVIDGLSASIPLLKEMITAASNAQELKENEILLEIVQQLQNFQSTMSATIEISMDHPELIEELFKLNDSSQIMLGLFSDLKEGSMSLHEAKYAIQVIGETEESDIEENTVQKASVENISNVKSNTTSNNQSTSKGNDLLDLFDAPIATNNQPIAVNTNTASKPAGPSTNNDPFNDDLLSIFDNKPAATTIVNNNVIANTTNSALDFDPFGVNAVTMQQPVASQATFPSSQGTNSMHQPFYATSPPVPPMMNAALPNNSNYQFNGQYYPNPNMQPTPAYQPAQFNNPPFNANFNTNSNNTAANDFNPFGL